MKKLLISIVGLGMSLAVSAETYDVSASYSAGAEYSGELVFRVDEGKSASFSNEQVQNFAVVVSKKTESQVLVNFDFAGGAYKSLSQQIKRGANSRSTSPAFPVLGTRTIDEFNPRGGKHMEE